MSLQTDYFLAKTHPNGTVQRLVDGSHDKFSKAYEAYFLHKRLGILEPDSHYAVVKVETLEMDFSQGCATLNEEALAQCAKMGLHE